MQLTAITRLALGLSHSKVLLPTFSEQLHRVAQLTSLRELAVDINIRGAIMTPTALEDLLQLSALQQLEALGVYPSPVNQGPGSQPHPQAAALQLLTRRFSWGKTFNFLDSKVGGLTQPDGLPGCLSELLLLEKTRWCDISSLPAAEATVPLYRL